MSDADGNITEPKNQTSRKWRPRFSLLTVLLVMALVACAVTIWQLWRELGPLRAEVKSRRAEMGQLFITDPKKAHAIAVGWNDDGVWRWRLYLPPDRNFVIYTYVGQHSTFPNDKQAEWLGAVRAGAGRIRSSVGGIRSGEYTFEIEFAKEGDQWHFQAGKGSIDPLPTSFNTWLDVPESWYPMSKVLYSEQSVFERGHPIVLLCLQRENESRTEGANGDTIVVWIEENR